MEKSTHPTHPLITPTFPLPSTALAVRMCSQALPVRNGYEIRLTSDTDALRAKADLLVDRMYRSRGLTSYSTDGRSHPRPLEQGTEQHNITVAACKAQTVAATLTLSLDMGAGLLADTLYRDIIDGARRKGGRVCEITRLAIDPEHESRDVMASMLQCLYILARLIYRITDVFIEVHPRHASFYTRKLGYRVAGPERTCPRVGAPAVLMHLCKNELEQLLDTHAGAQPTRLSSISSSLYQQFSSRSELERMGEHMRDLLLMTGGLKTSV